MMDNRAHRRRVAKLGYDPDKRTRVTDVKLGISGLEALSEQLPDDRWYRLSVYFNRAGVVHFSQQVDPIKGGPPK